ncbi:MAG TPA: hypothetical protein VFX98_07940 [Longimicrobiaceae bacterium]|nr:hypothetical protein [Longimicrobiaceae bacterium]
MNARDDGGVPASPRVRHFRHILLWPLQLVPGEDRQQVQRHWERLGRSAPGNPWFEVADEFAGDPGDFRMRHYGEFITFLPAVQRFLYGEGGEGGYGESPIRVFRRNDVARVRLTLDAASPPVELAVAHVDLYFFYDIEVVLLAVEAYADDLPLSTVEELLFRFGRSYPAFWEDDGRGGNCFAKVEWLSPTGAVVARSDYEDKEKFLSFVSRNREAAVSADWAYLVAPMVPHAAGPPGALRCHQLEYLRLPLMAYLAMDAPETLTRADFVRLAFATRAGEADRMPFSERALADFEEAYCYDHYWRVDDPSVASTRFLCTGNTLVVVGDAERPFFTDAERGVLAQFRHQYFLLGLIAHFHKAALLMFRHRLVNAVSRLDIRDPASIRGFKRDIRLTFEVFLRFTHRYWFHEVSIQAPAKPLYAMLRRHLGTRELYDEIRQEVQDVSQYLDSDGIRRQANTVVRLTVVTTAGLVGTIATGFLGMNLIAAAGEPLWARALYFVVVLGTVTMLTFYTITISKRLSEFMELLSDERLSLGTKLKAFARVFTGK